MAINGSGNGDHEFDPSKRICAALGGEFVSNVEAESTERLAQAMAATPVKNEGREYEEDNDMALKDLFKKTKHTTEAGEKLQEQANKKIDENPSNLNTRLSEVKLAEDRLTAMISKKSLPETIVREASGFGIKDNSKQNTTHAVNFAIKNLSSFIESDLIEPIVSGFDPENGGDKVKAVGAAIGVSAAIDFASSLCTNNQRINSIFDKNSISASEAAIIKSAIQKEKIKYATEHMAAGVILPSLAKIGLTKVIGQDKINNNKILKGVTSYGVLSTAGKLALSGIRKASEKKQIAKINAQQYSVTNNAPTSHYADLAKIAACHVLNEGIDNTLIGTTLGTVAGFAAEPIIKLESRPSLAGYKAQSSVVEKAAKPATNVPKTTTEAKPVAKKTA